MNKLGLLSWAVLAALASAPACAQDHRTMEGMDHSKMDHSTVQPMDHSKMDHGTMQDMDHSRTDHSAHPVPVQPLTDAERAAAFPPVHAHHKHGTSLQNYSLIDRLEVSEDHGKAAYAWEAKGWMGGDVQKFVWRSEGHGLDGKLERGDLELLYSRGVHAWWDIVAGVRQDFGQGPERTWAALGVQGEAPYKFHVSATAYAGPESRTALRLGIEYDTLLSARWILQWRAEANAYGRNDPRLDVGSGLSSIEAGMRLRYEIDRRFAPYIGVEHARAFGNTAKFQRAYGTSARDTRVVAGVRIWF